MNAQYSILESKLTDKLKYAERKLSESGIVVTRLVKQIPYSANECYGLQVFGDCLYHLEQVRSIIGTEYKLTLNTNSQSILIK